MIRFLKSVPCFFLARKTENRNFPYVEHRQLKMTEYQCVLKTKRVNEYAQKFQDYIKRGNVHLNLSQTFHFDLTRFSLYP